MGNYVGIWGFVNEMELSWCFLLGNLNYFDGVSEDCFFNDEIVCELCMFSL